MANRYLEGVESQATFGIEVELGIPQRAGVAIGQWRDTLQNRFAMSDGSRFVFEAGTDSSVRVPGCTNVEIKTPGPLNQRTLWQWCRGFGEWANAVDMKTNHTCGIHIHVGTQTLLKAGGVENAPWDTVKAWIKAFLVETSSVESAFFSAAGSTKRLINASYCNQSKRAANSLLATISGLRSQHEWESYIGRTGAVNIQRMFSSRGRTVEIRVFRSMKDPVLLYSWVCMTSALLHYCAWKAGCAVRAGKVPTIMPGMDKVLKLQGWEGFWLAALNRTFYMTGWVRGKTSRPPLFVRDREVCDAPEPTVKEMIRRLRKEAKFLDRVWLGRLRLRRDRQKEMALRVWRYFDTSATWNTADPMLITLPKYDCKARVVGVKRNARWVLFGAESAPVATLAKVIGVEHRLTDPANDLTTGVRHV